MRRFPVFDNHFHLDPKGGRAAAVREFAKAGGTHLMIVHKPYGDPPRFNATLDDHRRDMETTLRLADEVRKDVPDVRLWVALAPHPAEFTKMLEAGHAIADAERVYREASELAQRYVREGRAVAMGEVGRPHWTPVAPDVWDAANRLMEHQFVLAKDAGCPVIIHCETGTPEVYADLAGRCDTVGLARDKAVKHFSPPLVAAANVHGLLPSVLVGKDGWQKAVADGVAGVGRAAPAPAEAATALAGLGAAELRVACRMLWETDYMDDPRYPGAVLGPKTVPKRAKELLDAGGPEEALWVVHKEVPERAYGIEIAL